MEQLYSERLNRYVTAMRNEKPDRIPIRPFAAEFTARYAGFTCQEVTHDYEKAFEAVRKCAADFDWDATVPNMVYVWTGLTQAIGLNYYGIPGIDVPPDTGFQYIEPPEGHAHMRPDEYDALIEDPTGFLYNVWLPRVSNDVSPMGCPTSYRNNLSFVKGGMAMLSYFNAFGTQIARLRAESGTVSAIAGIFKAPFDIIADKLRGYLGLTMDMFERPDKVLAACEALMPHLLHVALTTADPDKNVPIGFWMHRGCVPFVTPEQFASHYWPTLKPIIEEIWANGHQTLFYAEGNWDAHLDSFAELPDGSIVYHVDQGDIVKVHDKIGHKFCLSGGIPNFLLGYGTPQEVRDHCKKVIDAVAQDGGYVMDASAIMQDDSKPENVRAMTDVTRDYGAYSSGTSQPAKAQASPADREAGRSADYGMPGRPEPKVAPGVCVPWDQKTRELPQISGDEQLVRSIWEQNDALGNMYIWQCLLSF
jgi:uroporphyrinogen-III decarboxylase